MMQVRGNFTVCFFQLVCNEIPTYGGVLDHHRPALCAQINTNVVLTRSSDVELLNDKDLKSRIDTNQCTMNLLLLHTQLFLAPHRTMVEINERYSQSPH